MTNLRAVRLLVVSGIAVCMIPFAEAQPVTGKRSVWVYKAPPAYPREAEVARLEGTTLVKVKIATDGTPERVEVTKSSGHQLLDEAAISAIRKWRAHKQFAGKIEQIPITFEWAGRDRGQITGSNIPRP